MTKIWKHYFGLRETPFKARYNNHTESFENEAFTRQTELSKCLAFER